MRPLLVVLALAAPAWAEPVQIHVAASRGQIIPQSKGGGGFQRTFRFTAHKGRANHWIRQVLEVRGTVFDALGRSTPAHLDVIEYYRVNARGKAKHDTHYSQYWAFRGGDLTITSTLTYGTLRSRKLGDTILGKGFVLRSATNAEGKYVTMKTRTRPRQVIPAEHGKRVTFTADGGAVPTRYSYRVRWDTRGSRTQPNGEIEVGTWQIEAPKQTGRTRAEVRPRPIPPLR